jgi:clostripain
MNPALFLALLSSMPASQAQAAERPWTILVYGAADNNADGPILRFLDQVRKALDDDPGMELVLFLDRSEGYSDDATLLGEDFTGARIYHLRRDSAERLSGGEEFPEITLEEDVEVDSADPYNIDRFVAFGKAHFPARRTALLIYSHANGRTMCPDEESERDMGIPELTDVVRTKQSVDFLALELCTMGGIEIAYQWRPGNGGFAADVLLAIPNAGPPLDWDRAFARIRTKGHASEALGPYLDPEKMTAADFGKLVVEEGERGRQEASIRGDGGEHEAAACYDLGAAADVKRAVDALAVELARSDTRAAFLALRGPSDPMDSGGDSGGDPAAAMNYERGGPFVDLYDLCARAAACEALGEGARSAARAVGEAVDRFVVASFGMDAYEGFEPGKNGVFIVLPGDDENGRRGSRWRRFDWYTPRPLAGGREPYGRWAFLRDGATEGNGAVENWFELLDSWFDDAGAGPGGINGYPW